jgi:hypothetical protein
MVAGVLSRLLPPWLDTEMAVRPDRYHRYAESGCDVLVAIGGGSVTDAATGIAILSGNGGSILEYAGVDQVMHPIPPLVMIPTTSGTGADVSQFCIVTDTGRSVKIHRSAAAHHDARVAQGRRTDVDTSALIRAIRDISRGGSAFDARSAAAMVRGIHAGSVESDKKLTAREQEVLEPLSRGMSNSVVTSAGTPAGTSPPHWVG